MSYKNKYQFDGKSLFVSSDQFGESMKSARFTCEEGLV